MLKDSVGGSVPSEVDRRLLVVGSRALGGAPLSPAAKRLIRGEFLEACRNACLGPRVRGREWKRPERSTMRVAEGQPHDG